MRRRESTIRSSVSHPRSSYIETSARFCADIKTLITRRGGLTTAFASWNAFAEIAGAAVVLRRIEELAFESYRFRESHQQVPSEEQHPGGPSLLFSRVAHAEPFSFYTAELRSDTFSPDWLLMASIRYFINSSTDKLQCCHDSSWNEYTAVHSFPAICCLSRNEKRVQYLCLSCNEAFSPTLKIGNASTVSNLRQQKARARIKLGDKLSRTSGWSARRMIRICRHVRVSMIVF